MGETLTAVRRLVDRDAADHLRARVAALRRERRRLRGRSPARPDRPTSSAAGDIGSTLRVLETATNAEGSASAQSAPTAVVTGMTAPVSTGDPVVSGSTVEGATLTTTTGTWTGTSLTFAYQWVRCGAGRRPARRLRLPVDPRGDELLLHARRRRHRAPAPRPGHRRRTRRARRPPPRTRRRSCEQSTTTGPPRIIVEPSISGTLVLGRLLFASVGTWAGETPLSYAYQWVRCGADGGLPDGSNCTSISGATASTYTLAGRRRRRRACASGSRPRTAWACRRSRPMRRRPVQSSSTTTPSQAPVNTRAPVIFGQPARRRDAHVERRALDGDDAAPLLLPVAALPGERRAGDRAPTAPRSPARRVRSTS